MEDYSFEHDDSLGVISDEEEHKCSQVKSQQDKQGNNVKTI